jgi:hypothetical protein
MSDYDWVFLLQNKSEAAGEIIGFIKRQEKRNISFKHGTIEFFSSDNGGEFTDNILNDFLSERGISHQYQPAYTPEV